VSLQTRCLAALLASLAATIPIHRLAAQMSPPAAVILSPEPGERVPADQVLVAVTLPRGAPADSVSVRLGSRDVSAEATLADGVLTIRIPKHPSAKPRKIQISGGGNAKQLGE